MARAHTHRQNPIPTSSRIVHFRQKFFLIRFDYYSSFRLFDITISLKILSTQSTERPTDPHRQTIEKDENREGKVKEKNLNEQRKNKNEVTENTNRIIY